MPKTVESPAPTGPDRSLTALGWVVVARHREPAHVGLRAPWGAAHLKRIGSQVTYCGAPTLGWHAFWHLDAGDVRSWCAECAAARPPRSGTSGGL